MVEAETELFWEGVEEEVVAGAAMKLEWVAREVEELPSDWVTIEVTTLMETVEEVPGGPPMLVLTVEGDVRVVVESVSEDPELETVKTLAAGSEKPDEPTANMVGLEDEEDEEDDEEEVVEEDWAPADTA